MNPASAAFLTSLSLLFSLFLALPPLGAARMSPLQAGARFSPAQDNIVISEFRARGLSALDQFIEFFNPTDAPIDVSGWIVKTSDGTGNIYPPVYTFPSGTEIPPGAHYLIVKINTDPPGYSGGTTPDGVFESSKSITDDGGIALMDAPNSIVDQVGMMGLSPFIDGDPLPTIQTNADQSYARMSGGSAGSCVDSDNNASDFIYRRPSDPQNLQSVTPAACNSKINQSISFSSTPPSDATVGGPPTTPSAEASSGLVVEFSIDPASASTCSFEAGEVTYLAVGTCKLNADQAGDAVFNPAPRVQQSFPVGKGSQVITFTTASPASATVGGTPYSPAASATSGLAVSLSIDASASIVCSMEVGSISFLSDGTCVVNANQSGNANFLPAPQVQQSFAVNKASQVISFTTTAPTNAAIGSGGYVPAATASSGLPVTLTIDAIAAAVCTMNAGVVSYTSAGTCVINANQAGNGSYQPAPQVQQSFPVGQVATPTPAAPNHLVISEFRSLGPNGASDEFVELFNPTGASVNIGGWSIRRSSGCGTTIATLVTIPASIILKPGQHYLVASDESNLSGANQTYSASLADDGGVALLSSNATVIDQVGMCSTTQYKEETVLAPLTSISNQSYERKPGGSTSCYDTNSNTADFKAITPANPQNMASPIQMCTGVTLSTPTRTPSRTPSRTATRTATSLPGSVMINEFLPHPAMDWDEDGTVNTGDEYIELINMGTDAVILKNWVLDDSNGGSSPYPLPAITLLPRQVVVFFQSETGISLSDGGDTVRLLKPDGRTADSFTYPVVTNADRSWCRLPDGIGVLAFTCQPTPGEPNRLQSSLPTPSLAATQQEVKPACLAGTVPEQILLAECTGTGVQSGDETPLPQFWLEMVGKFAVFVE